METILIVVVLLALLAVVIALFRKPPLPADISTPLQNLTQVIQQTKSQTDVMADKLKGLSPLQEAVATVRVELSKLSERVGKVENNQVQANQGMVSLETGLTRTGTLTQGLVDTTNAMRSELSRAKNDLTELQSQTKARQDLEQRSAESIRRLETIIAGTQTKGSAGENILDFMFAKLPTEWQIRDLRIGNRTVEFALRLPNELILPIDSKWAATNLLEQYCNCSDSNEQQKLKSKIEATVLEKAKEVKKYIDPNITVNFGVAAVPDSVYDLCGAIQVEAFHHNVVLISYSMFLPYLMLVFQTILKSAQNINLEKLDAYLQSTQAK